MKPFAVLLSFGVAATLAAGTLAVEPDAPPAWAYVVNPPGSTPAPDDGTPLHVPGSSRTFTATQLRDVTKVPDWHPDDHPAMPDSVATGPRKGVFACGFCHLPNGLGRPENASLAGLPAEYIVRQVAAFRTGERTGAEPRSLPTNFMISSAKGATDEEVSAAAEYFASLPPRPWIRVVETDTVPKTHVAGWMLVEDVPGRDRAHRPADRRGPGRPRTHRAPRFEIRIRRVRPGRQRRPRRDPREGWRSGPDASVRRLPRRGPPRPRPHPGPRRALTELSRAAASRHATRSPAGILGPADEARGRAADRRRHHRDRGVRGVAGALIDLRSTARRTRLVTSASRAGRSSSRPGPASPGRSRASASALRVRSTGCCPAR
jgi:cytochrome c553